MYRGYEEHYSNGQIKILKYLDKDGLPVGQSKKWYENGQLWRSDIWLNSNLDGSQIEWHKNGKLAAKRNYIGPALNGEYKTWNDKGFVIRQGYYINGILLDDKFDIYKKQAWLHIIKRIRLHINIKKYNYITNYLNKDLSCLCLRYIK